MPRGARSIAGVALVAVLAACTLSGCTTGEVDQPTASFVTPSPPGDSTAAASDGAAASDSAGAEPGATAADVEFIAAMIEHHLQAVELAELAPGRVSDPELAEFADRIAVVQAAEADAMRAWLDKRRSRDRANGAHDHGVMAGEISRSTFDRAATLSGPAFDELFIAAMVPHHRGALEMAEERLAEHGDSTVARWARAIATSQSLEIDRLLEIEARLRGG